MAFYLVTGGCGFIGSHLCDRLIAQGHTVRILDNLSTGNSFHLPTSCELVVGDTTDETTVNECFTDIDYCYHLAAVSSVAISNLDWKGTHRVNQSAALNIFQAATRRRTPVVYASSAAVYGDNADTALKETSVTRPLTAYGADKLGTEAHARVASVVHKVPTTGLRLFNVYGPRQNENSTYSGVISSFANALRSDRPITIFGNGEQLRDFVYVDDAVHFLITAMQRISATPNIYNVCTGRSVSINQLAKTMMSITGKQADINYRSARAGDIRTSTGDPSLANQQLGVQTETSLASGLYRLLPELERYPIPTLTPLSTVSEAL